MAKVEAGEKSGSYVDVQQALADLQLARAYRGQRLTAEELARQLAVLPVEGRIRGRDLVYACQQASLNPDIQSLPLSGRIQIISSAMGILEEVDKVWDERKRIRRGDTNE